MTRTTHTQSLVPNFVFAFQISNETCFAFQSGASNEKKIESGIFTISFKWLLVAVVSRFVFFMKNYNTITIHIISVASFIFSVRLAYSLIVQFDALKAATQHVISLELDLMLNGPPIHNTTHHLYLSRFIQLTNHFHHFFSSRENELPLCIE